MSDSTDLPPTSASTLYGEGTPSPQQRSGHAFSFIQTMVDAGILSREQVAQVQEVARRERLSLGRVLVREGLVLSRDLAALMALHLGIAMVDLRSQAIDPHALALLPEEIARRYMVLPIKSGEGRLMLAMADPMDLQLVQDLTVRTETAIEPVVATSEDILEHIDITYRLTQGPSEGSHGALEGHGAKVTAGLLKDLPPAQVIDLLLRQGLQDRASDIHVEPTEFRLRVRFRIDGILHDVMSLPMEMHPTLVSRLKIMAGMNIAERRRPQDGQFTVDVQNRRVDVRVGVSSTVEGEMVVLRLLDKRFTLIGLDQLGMSLEVWEKYRRLLRLPYGMVVVCGPTGAGKSTTLYSSILQINRIEQNVISLEDPVEYHIADCNQMQVHTEAGITFATQLRSIMRLDPDVILVGEIRDQETATIATQAALTGHLVLTSLHANDAVSALLRLRDLGVAPYLIASSVAGIVSQRMVRVVCSGCRTVTPRPVEEQTAYASEMGEVREQFIYGSGCNLCAHTGYRGRTGVFELMALSDNLRQLFLGDASRSQLWKEAVEEGMIPLRRDGMLKVKQGITTPYEMMRVLFALE
ncbi:MAG: secretion system protein [Dehalococcoidia bacterium]|nr:secretion system protein [Dehalococcoidia bacterium]